MHAGNAFVCGLFTNAVYCWGQNDAGQLLLGTTEDRGARPNELGPALSSAALPPAAKLALGVRHACALVFENGATSPDLVCWGENTSGQLGLGDMESRGDELGDIGELGANFPRVAIDGDVTALTLGGSFTCAVIDDARVICWGGNAHGQLGRGTTAAYGDEPGEAPALLDPIDL
jgi:alpha-tubulin suppressor-like RCC1 family protein